MFGVQIYLVIKGVKELGLIFESNLLRVWFWVINLMQVMHVRCHL